MADITTVDGYIEAAPSVSRDALRELRGLVLEAVPDVTERISYGMPTYEVRGQRLLHFAAAKSHFAVYGLVHEDRAVPAALRPYLRERSTLRFQYGQPPPTSAIRDAIRGKAERLREG